MVDDDDIGSQCPGMFEGSAGLPHLVQAELEQDDIAARLNGQEVTLEIPASIRETQLGTATTVRSAKS